MNKWTRIIGAGLLLPAFFAAGLYAGPLVSQAARHLFPPPQYETGDFSALQREAGSRVVMYSTSTCPYCAKARDLFAAAGISYRDYVIDESEQVRTDFQNRGGTVVPLLFIGKRKIVGYREDAIRQALQHSD